MAQSAATPRPLEAHLSWRKVIGSGFFAFTLAAVIGLMLRDNAASAQAYEGWRLWIRVVAAVGAAALGLVMLAGGAQAFLRRKTLVAAGPDGLRCPSLYGLPVPWSEIAFVTHEKPRIRIAGSGRLIIGVIAGHRFDRRRSVDLKPAATPGGVDAAQLPQLLDVPIERLMAAIEAYRTPYGDGER